MRSWIRRSVIAFLFAASALARAQADLPQCSDGIDNDNDGLVDFPADPDCTGPDGLSESPRDLSAFVDGNVADLAQGTGFQNPDGGGNASTGPNPAPGAGTRPERDQEGCACAIGGQRVAYGPLGLVLGLLALRLRRRRA